MPKGIYKHKPHPQSEETKQKISKSRLKKLENKK